jgi:hypothetical protein
MWHWRLALATVANTLLLFIRRIKILFSPESFCIIFLHQTKVQMAQDQKVGRRQMSDG